MAPPPKTAVKKKDWPKKRLEFFERGMTVAQMKAMFMKLGGAKPEGEPDEPAEPDDPDDTEEVDPKDGFTIGIARAKAITVPDPKDTKSKDSEFKEEKLPKRSILIVKKKKSETALKAALLDVPGFEAPTYSFGKIRIDPESSTTLLLEMEGANKSVVKGLKQTIKKSGCAKIILVEGGKRIDADAIAEDEGGETGVGVGGDQSSSSVPPPPWNPAELNARYGKLLHEFADVAKSIPDKVLALRTAAEAARTAIGGGVEEPAVQAVDAFEKALQEAKASATSNGGEAAKGSTLAKSGQAWSATLKKVEEELGKLEKALVDHYGDQPYVGQLRQLYKTKTGPIFTTLNQTLATKLEEASAAAPEDQQKLVGEAKELLNDAQSWVVGNELLTQLDENPFVALQTKKLLNLTIGALKKSLA